MKLLIGAGSGSIGAGTEDIGAGSGDISRKGHLPFEQDHGTVGAGDAIIKDEGSRGEGYRD